MDGERIPTGHIRSSRICPGCGVNPAAPITYGGRDSRRLLCDDCAADSHRRSDEIMAAIEAMRAAQERRTDD